MKDWLNQPAPFLFAPMMFGLFLAIFAVIAVLWERAQDRKRKDEAARRNQKSA
jgi:hypothetical protein